MQNPSSALQSDIPLLSFLFQNTGSCAAFNNLNTQSLSVRWHLSLAVYFAGDWAALMHFTLVQLDSPLNQTCLFIYCLLQQHSCFPQPVSLGDSALSLKASCLTNLMIAMCALVLLFPCSRYTSLNWVIWWYIRIYH